MNRQRYHLGLAMLAVICCGLLQAEDSAVKPSPTAREPHKPAVPELKPEQETLALAFAGEHHPELKALIESLKTANPEGYKKAIHELARTHDRLSKVQANGKGNDRFAHELALWKLDSRIRLTAARSAMRDTDELRSELKSLVEQRQQLALQGLRDDQARTAARLEKIDRELKAAESKLPGSVDAEVDRLLKSVKSSKPRISAAIKDAKKTGKTTPKSDSRVKTPEEAPGSSSPSQKPQP